MGVYYFSREGMKLLAEKGEGIVLAPSLYWYIQKELPTKSLHKAKRYAASLVNDAPEGFRELVVFKNGNLYDIYAYDPELLKRAVDSFDHPMPIYALQQFVEQLPSRIDENHVARAIEGVAVVLPDGEGQKLSAFAPNVSTIRPLLENYGDRRSSRSSTLVIVALIVLTTAAVFDTLLHIQRYQMASRWLENQQTDRTLYEIKSMIRRYEKIENSYRKRRQEIVKILQKSRLRSVTCDEKGCRSE